MRIRYRHEWKHEIRYADLLAIRQRLRDVAVSDPHPYEEDDSEFEWNVFYEE